MTDAREYAEFLMSGGWEPGIPLPDGVPYPWEIKHREREAALAASAKRAITVPKQKGNDTCPSQT